MTISRASLTLRVLGLKSTSLSLFLEEKSLSLQLRVEKTVGYTGFVMSVSDSEFS